MSKIENKESAGPIEVLLKLLTKKQTMWQDCGLLNGRIQLG